MELFYHSYTNIGGRENNEDFALANIIDGNKSNFVLCDGLGGHKFGEVASEGICKFIVDESKKISQYDERALLELLDSANSYLIDGQKLFPEMRTTVVAAFIENGYMTYFNVGDSRLYYFKNGCLYTQSKDHTVSQISVAMGEIKLEEIRFHEDRNRLLKVLGNDESLNIKKLSEPIKIEENDALLLCSDGFWEYVYETEMEADLVKSKTPKEWLDFMIKRILLKELVNNDNFTAIAVLLKNNTAM